MTLPRSAADVLKEHVTMQLECIDRMYLNVYQPKLAFEEGIVHFFRSHKGQPIASSALMTPITNDFVGSIHRFIAASGIDLVHFKKGERKDDIAHEYLAEHDGSEGILFVGRAQEKANVFRTERRRNPLTGRTYPWLVPDTAMVNHFYRSSKIKQYHKEGAALRTETTINDARSDFKIGKRLHNLAALAKVGFSANRRLLDVQRISQEPWAGEEAVESISHPVEIAAQRAPGLRFGDRRVHALMSTLLDFRLLPSGFSNRDLRARLHERLGRDFSPGSMTYDLRRLRLRGLIERVPCSNRYRVTDIGVRTAALYSRTHQRILVPAMADLVRPIGSGRLSRALRQLDQALDAA